MNFLAIPFLMSSEHMVVNLVALPFGMSSALSEVSLVVIPHLMNLQAPPQC